MSDKTTWWREVVTGQRRGILPMLLRVMLRLAGVPYALVMRCRNTLYDRGWLRVERVDVPVVVIGNLSVGGTGKTPAVEYVARYYREHGVRVAILSRGYGVSDGRNDEAHVLEANLDDVPHLQGVDRVELARRAIEELDSELLVLDDGFQHRRLYRDLNLVLMDATQPLGGCFPGGLLREPLDGLRRADAVILTRCDQAPADDVASLHHLVARYAPRCLVAYSRHAPLRLHNTREDQEVNVLLGRPVGALCGIGHPAGFLATIRDLGAEVVSQQIYPDHHAYRREDVADIEAWARQLPDGAWLVTTQKDWVKLRVDALGGKPLWSLRVALEINEGRQALHDELLSVFKKPAAGAVGDKPYRADPPSTPRGSAQLRKEAYDPAQARTV